MFYIVADSVISGYRLIPAHHYVKKKLSILYIYVCIVEYIKTLLGVYCKFLSRVRIYLKIVSNLFKTLFFILFFNVSKLLGIYYEFLS